MTEPQSPLNSTPSNFRPPLPPPPPPRQNVANNANAGTQKPPLSALDSTNAQVNAHQPAPLPPTSAHQPAPLPPTSAHQPARSSFGKDVQPTLEKLVLEAYEQGASDLHLGVGEVPRFRERGQITICQYPQTDEATFFSWIGEILTVEQIEKFREEMEYDGATQYEGLVRVRINIFVSLNGPAMVMRLIPLKILSMDQLSLPPVFRDLCHYPAILIMTFDYSGR